MQLKFPNLEPLLYIVSTPIGTASDFSYRATHVLANVDIIIAEDTRLLKKLLHIVGIDLHGRSIYKYNDNSSVFHRDKCIEALREGRSVAFCCDAGTPLVSDPGYKLVDQVIKHGFEVRVVPGASAVLVALCQSGLSSETFFFGGFPPTKSNKRVKFFEECSELKTTTIFFESSKRLLKSLEDLAKIFGRGHKIVIFRELTKKFEESRRGQLGDLIDGLRLGGDFRGEITIVVDKKSSKPSNIQDMISELELELRTSTLKDVSTKLALKYFISKKEVYTEGLKILNELE